MAEGNPKIENMGRKQSVGRKPGMSSGFSSAVWDACVFPVEKTGAQLDSRVWNFSGGEAVREFSQTLDSCFPNLYYGLPTGMLWLISQLVTRVNQIITRTFVDFWRIIDRTPSFHLFSFDLGVQAGSIDFVWLLCFSFLFSCHWFVGRARSFVV